MHSGRVYALLIDTPGEEQSTTLYEAIPGLVTAVQSM
jgi:hypothetical protein